MLKKVTVALAALFFLAACSSSHKSGLNTSTNTHNQSKMEMSFEKEVGDRVFFAYDSSELSMEAKEQLHKQITWLKAHHTTKATIAGNCDERGTREYNLALGERRAEKVKKFLTHHGVEAHRLDTISYGKEQPSVMGDNEAAWSKNRNAITMVK